MKLRVLYVIFAYFIFYTGVECESINVIKVDRSDKLSTGSSWYNLEQDFSKRERLRTPSSDSYSAKADDAALKSTEQHHNRGTPSQP